MYTHRRCPCCKSRSICMKALANSGKFMCRECWQPVRVSRLWRYGANLFMLVSTFLLFQFTFRFAGAILFFPSLMLLAGNDIYAVRWFPLTRFKDSDFVGNELDKRTSHRLR